MSEQRPIWTVSQRNKAIGRSKQPLYDGARWLLANNAASESDTIAVYRGETLSMHGIVGDVVKWTMIENDHGNSTFEFRPYRAFPTSTVRPRTANSGRAARLLP